MTSASLLILRGLNCQCTLIQGSLDSPPEVEALADGKHKCVRRNRKKSEEIENNNYNDVHDVD